MTTERKILLRVNKAEAETIRAALAAHRQKLAHALPKAKRAKDAEHHTVLVAESRATSQMITEIDRIVFEAAQ